MGSVLASAQPVHLPTKHTLGPAYEALTLAARRIDGDTVFVAGPGSTATALWAAEQGASVIAWMDNVAEARALKAAFIGSGHAVPLVSTAPDFADLQGGHCTTAIVYLPRGAEVQAELLHLAGAMLRPGGRLVFGGAVVEGVKGAVQVARGLFGQAGVVTRHSGYHAALARCPKQGIPMPDARPHTASGIIDSRPATLIWYPGVFAAGRVDVGAAALIGAMETHPEERILDLGCGMGVVSLAALRRDGCVEATDVSSRAVASTRATLAANGYPAAAVHLADLGDTLASASYDVVLANPPFHRGHGVDLDTAQGFIAAASRLTRPGGRLYLVANAFLSYEGWLTPCFRTVEVRWSDGKYRVWKCTR